MAHHADSSLVPSTIETKAEFWTHVHDQLEHLLEDQTNWVSNLSNASSLIYNSLLAFPKYFGNGDRAVNWAGFYIDSRFFPQPLYPAAVSPNTTEQPPRLLLGPFSGKPACQYINVPSHKPPKGVCAAGFLTKKTVLVPNVEEFPGHIACDGDTKSEIVIPLLLKVKEEQVVLGVLDLDCLGVGGFGEEDKEGLEKIVELVVKASHW
ncbi:GAF domain-like protein [Flagelloscypha sp. PMI_526]|nr:GAF domain-like protein [Flagelloscypha sp. PMI_526]